MVSVNTLNGAVLIGVEQMLVNFCREKKSRENGPDSRCDLTYPSIVISPQCKVCFLATPSSTCTQRLGAAAG